MTTKVSKNLLDTVYVSADGTTPVTGDLVVSKADPVLFLKSTAAGPGSVVLQNSAGFHVGEIIGGGDGTTLSLTKNDAIGSLETQLVLNNSGNVSINGLEPSDVSHLTRKDYVDDTTVSLTGDIMTGTLIIRHPTAEANLQLDAASTFAPTLLFLENQVLKAVLRYNPSAQTVTLDNRAGGSTKTIIMHDDGNLSSGALAPSAIAHLTRKDYVDDNFVNIDGTSTMTGNLLYSDTDFEIQSTTNAKRILVEGGVSATIGAGAYIACEGNDYGGVGLGGHMYLVAGTAAGEIIATSNISQTSSVPSDVSHLTRKDYVDTTTVALDGTRTMTGDLLISNSSLPALRIFNSTASSVGFRVSSSAGADALLDVTDNGGSYAASVASFASSGIATFLKNPLSSATQSTATTALTRKDYVDTTTVALDGSRTMTGTLRIGSLGIRANAGAPAVSWNRDPDTGTIYNGANNAYVMNQVGTGDTATLDLSGYPKAGGAQTFTHSFRHNGDVDFDGKLSFSDFVSTDGTLQLYQGDVATGYAIGVESGTLFARANGNHRWYISTLADAGVSQKMHLDINGLDVVGDVSPTGALNLGSTQQATIEFNATENSIDFIIN